MAEIPKAGSGPSVQKSLLSLDLALIRRDVLVCTPPEGSISGPLSTTPERTSALNPLRYAPVPHNHLLVNEVDKSPAPNMFSIAHWIVPGSLGHFCFLQVGINYLEDQDSKTTMLLGLSTLIDILAGGIIGFELHPLDEKLSLPCLSTNRVKESFLGLAVVAFWYFLVRDKRNQGAQALAAGSAPSPHRLNDEEDYKAPMAM
jgi:hypothetical protein